MSAPQHCTAARAVVEARRAAGPFHHAHLARGVLLRPQPAARLFPIVQVVSEICGNSLPVPRTRRRGVFSRQRSAIKHCGAPQHGAAWGSTPHGRFLPSNDGTHLAARCRGGSLRARNAENPPASLRAGGRAAARLGGDWLQPFSFPSYKPAQVFGARRHVLLLAAQIIDQFQPARIDTHIEAVNLRLRGHVSLRQVRHVQNIWMPRSSVKCPAWVPAWGTSDESDVGAFTDLTDLSVHFTLRGINNTGAAMNFKLSTLAAAAALLVNCSAPVMAEMVAMGTVSGWEINGDKDVCTATQYFANGTRLVFGYTGNDGIAMLIGNLKWNIPDGLYPVVMSVDRAPSETFQASGNKGTVAWRVEISEASVNLLMNGAVLHATVGQQKFDYRLTGSTEMLLALGRCSGAKTMASNPFAGQPPANPFAETASNPYRRM